MCCVFSKFRLCAKFGRDFSRCMQIVYFVSSAERRILTQKRVATRSRGKIRSARDTNDMFCSLCTESLPSRCLFACEKLVFRILNFPALVWENQLSARKTTPTGLTFGIRQTKMKYRVKNL